jgi:hypothetical protein
MKKGKDRLRLVSGNESLFDDLGALRQLPPVSTRRARSTETFARIPHNRGRELARRKLSGAAWALLIELDRLILKSRGRNPVKLCSARMNAAGINRHARLRALRQLEEAGTVRVERRGKGRSPWVLHLWFSRQD